MSPRQTFVSPDKACLAVLGGLAGGGPPAGRDQGRRHVLGTGAGGAMNRLYFGDNPNFPPLEVSNPSELQVLGVVMRIVDRDVSKAVG